MNDGRESGDGFQHLYAELKRYIQLQFEYTKVEAVEKITILLSTLLVVGLVIALSLVVLFYLCFALAYALEPVLGSLALSFVLVSAIYILLIVLLVIFRKKIIVNPLVRFLSRLFLKNDEEL